MHKSLKVKKLANYSCLAKGAAFTAAAMHCGYDGFEETSFAQPHNTDKQLGATINKNYSMRNKYDKRLF